MKQKWMKVLGIVFSASIMLTALVGCQGNNFVEKEDTEQQLQQDVAETGGKGRFMESELSLPEKVSAVLAMEKLADGTIEIYTKTQAIDGEFCQAYVSDDLGKTFQTLPMEHTEEMYIETAAIDSEGNVAEILCAREDETLTYYVQHVSKDGNMNKNKLLLQNDKLLVTGAAFDTAGNFFVQSLGGSIYKVALDSGNVSLFCDLEGKSSRSFEVVGNKIFALTPEGILLFDSLTGEALEAEKLLDEMIQADRSLADIVSDSAKPLVFSEGINEEGFAYATNDGIYYHTIGGNVSELLVNGSITSLTDTSIGFGSLVMADKEHFLVQIVMDGKAKILFYQYEPDVSAVPEAELRVYALNDTVVLRQMIASYQKKNPDTYVNLQIGLSEEDGMTTEDALRALSTEILAGNGPDVMILDGMPVENYVEKGILMDISDVVEQIDASEGLFENVVSAYEQKGKIYTIPTRFYFNAVAGMPEAVAAGTSLEKLASYGEQLKASGEKNIISYSSKKELLECLYYMDAVNWETEDGKIDEEALRSFLLNAQKLYQLDAKKEISDLQIGNIKDTLYNSLGVYDVLLGESEIGLGTLVNTSGVVSAVAANKKMNGSYGLAGTESAGTILPYGMVGIINNTNEPEAAKNFVKEALSAENISSSGGGFPTNRMAYDAQCEMAKSQYTTEDSAGVVVSTDEGATVEVKFENMTEEEVTYMTKILESLTKPMNTDEVVKQIVLEEAERYLNETQSLNDTVSSIMQKYKLYSAE